MGGLLGAFVLFSTVLIVVAIGILTAYGTVIVILQAFAPQSQKPTGGRPILVHSRARAAAAAGD